MFDFRYASGRVGTLLNSLLYNYYFSSKIFVDKLNVTRWCGYDVSSMNSSDASGWLEAFLNWNIFIGISFR